MPKSSYSAALIVLGSSISIASANTLSLEPSQDNTLFQKTGGLLSNGSGPHAFIGRNGGGVIRRALVQFDVSLLPAGSTIDAAALTLSVSQSQGTTPAVTLQRVLQAWGEGASDSGSPGGSGAASAPGDATWIHTFFNTGTWNSAGGDFAATISGSAAPAGFGTFTIPSSPDMVADVQNWLGIPAGNFGWILRGVEASVSNVIRIDSREHDAPENRPHLTINFTPPTSNWTLDAAGDWDNPANWSGAVPDAPGVISRLGDVISAPRAVQLASPRTVGELNLQSAQPYAVSGATLTFHGIGADAALRVLGGNHVVSSPVVLATNAQLHAAAVADTLTLGGDLIIAPGVSVSKTGLGTIVVRNVRADALSIDGGVLAIAADGSDVAASRVASLSVSSGSLDLRDNDLIVDYDQSSVPSVIRAMLADGRIASSSATSQTRLGFADNTALGLVAFSGQTVDATSILVKFTYSGDANLDGQVDITDLAALATAWQTSGDWINGDFDYSGFVDITDLAALATNWQAGVSAPLSQTFEQALTAARLPVTVVPEPAGLVALLAGLATVQWRRRR